MARRVRQGTTVTSTDEVPGAATRDAGSPPGPGRSPDAPGRSPSPPVVVSLAWWARSLIGVSQIRLSVHEAPGSGLPSSDVAARRGAFAADAPARCIAGRPKVRPRPARRHDGESSAVSTAECPARVNAPPTWTASAPARSPKGRPRCRRARAPATRALGRRSLPDIRSTRLWPAPRGGLSPARVRPPDGRRTNLPFPGRPRAAANPRDQHSGREGAWCPPRRSPFRSSDCQVRHHRRSGRGRPRGNWTEGLIRDCHGGKLPRRSTASGPDPR